MWKYKEKRKKLSSLNDGDRGSDQLMRKPGKGPRADEECHLTSAGGQRNLSAMLGKHGADEVSCLSSKVVCVGERGEGHVRREPIWRVSIIWQHLGERMIS